MYTIMQCYRQSAFFRACTGAFIACACCAGMALAEVPQAEACVMREV
ncbi:MAG: hypothetical protein NC345_08095 [Lachnospira sp.]|nr:hypothetical protein [Lachnospira sp.]